MKRIGWMSVGLLAAIISAQAHPGHAPFSNGAVHFVSSPFHVLPFLIVSALVLLVARSLKQVEHKRLLRALAALIALCAFI